MKELVKPVREFWHCLTSVGLDGRIEEKDKKYIRFTNVIAALTAAAVFMYIPFSVIQGNFLLGALQSVDAVCILIVLWLNYRHYYKVSRLAYIFIVNSFVLINSCFIGFESHVQDFFYISYIVPFLLFSVKDYRNIAVGVIIAIVFFNIYQAIYPFFISYNLDMASQHQIYSINVWMKFILFGIAIYILSYYNFSSETELAESNSKLQKQAEELKRSNEDLEQFASIISHDLKAPVRNVSSFMDLLAMRFGKMLPLEAMEFIEMSKNSTNRMSRQIDDLLSYSKLGRDLPAARDLDLNQLVRTIQIEMGEKIKEKNARLISEQPLPKLQQVHSSMIHHVFQNLIANGIKFNLSSEPEVKLSFKTYEDSYEFKISDNGIGIEKSQQEKLFQMFKRLHGESEFEGTGIGLAVCKKIVNFYGGQIWIESEKNKGTAFYFTLPRHRSLPATKQIAQLSDTRLSSSVAFN